MDSTDQTPFDEWQPRANCRNTDPDLFFPDDGMGVIKAQRICKGCPVVNECLTYALDRHIDHGVWGGKSERQRRALQRERRRGLVSSTSG
jgi:WhiB family redox-sensing transcriptional regulator